MALALNLLSAVKFRRLLFISFDDSAVRSEDWFLGTYEVTDLFKVEREEIVALSCPSFCYLIFLRDIKSQQWFAGKTSYAFACRRNSTNCRLNLCKIIVKFVILSCMSSTWQQKMQRKVLYSKQVPWSLKCTFKDLVHTSDLLVIFLSTRVLQPCPHLMGCS